MPPDVELELELDDDELDELLLDELELLEVLDVDELLELEELELLDEPVLVHPVGCGFTPLIVMLSIFASPLLLVACNRMLFQPGFSVTVTLSEFAHAVHEPVPLRATEDTCVAPLTIT